MDDTPEDRAAIQPLIDQVMVYPLNRFTGTPQSHDWSTAPSFPAAERNGSGEIQWVHPQTFFETLLPVLDDVPPRAGEEALYAWVHSVLDAAADDEHVMAVLRAAAADADREPVRPLFDFTHVGVPVGFYLERDADGETLGGEGAYSGSFAPGQLPPVRGFWSLTLYNERHFFHPNELNRYPLGTRNKDLVLEDDGGLTLHAGGEPAGPNWLPASSGRFELHLRAYWPEQAILDGSWVPPAAVRVR
jgi:hypothetical protein